MRRARKEDAVGPSTTDVVVVGAGLTAALVAETLRDRGHAGRITLVGDEVHRPYERPPLSKGVLTGTADRETLFVHEPGWYPSHGVELLVGTTVRAVDRRSHQVVLDGGERLPYGSLVLATGARPRVLAVPGGPLRGVFHLRRVEDAERLRAALVQATRVAVIGGGWIGLEVAAAARGAGAEVTVLHRGELPLDRVLGAEMALDLPFGIGPLQFHRYFPEDTHNSYLNAFMSGGWLSGICYPALVFTTVITGFRHVFVRVPWRIR